MLQNSDENIMFIDILWLRTFGLTKENVLDYFALSPFYDPTSNNQSIRTQGVDKSHLLNMEGIEFALEETSYEPTLFIVKKLFRTSPRSSKVLEIYYVRIYHSVSYDFKKNNSRPPLSN